MKENAVRRQYQFLVNFFDRHDGAILFPIGEGQRFWTRRELLTSLVETVEDNQKDIEIGAFIQQGEETIYCPIYGGHSDDGSCRVISSSLAFDGVGGDLNPVADIINNPCCVGVRFAHNYPLRLGQQ